MSYTEREDGKWPVKRQVLISARKVRNAVHVMQTCDRAEVSRGEVRKELHSAKATKLRSLYT